MPGDIVLQNREQTEEFCAMYLITLISRDDIFISGIMQMEITGPHHGSRSGRIWKVITASAVTVQVTQECWRIIKGFIQKQDILFL